MAVPVRPVPMDLAESDGMLSSGMRSLVSSFRLAVPVQPVPMDLAESDDAAYDTFEPDHLRAMHDAGRNGCALEPTRDSFSSISSTTAMAGTAPPGRPVSRSRSNLPINSTDVVLHVYHCDPVTGFLNRAVLKQAQIGIYHCGVEVYGDEWCFQYYDDTWDDPSISGVSSCLPMRMEEYEYQESVNLGRTPRSITDVEHILHILRGDWPASSYHITRRNCLTFAETLAGLLQAPKPFPNQLKGILEASRNNANVDAIVDYSWSWMKWFMHQKYQREVAERDERDEQRFREEREERALASSVAGDHVRLQDHVADRAAEPGLLCHLFHTGSMCAEWEPSVQRRGVFPQDV